MTAGLVVVGASLAGLRSVQAARRSGFGGPITLIGNEEYLPYDRPPLSKAYLSEAGVPHFFVTPEELDELGVALRLSTTATALDPDNNEIVIGDERIPYDSVVLATGASPRGIPSFPDVDGIVTLRTLDDANRIRKRLRPGLNVVVVGGGFIGSEIASSAHDRGSNVVILEAASVPLVRAVGDVVGAAISTLHARNGVTLICDARVDDVQSAHGEVTGILLETGQFLAADLVVVGVGAAPATSWLVSSGVELHPLDQGVVANEFLESSIAGVYAAGDLVHWPNALMDSVMRLENWTSAAEQGARAGANAVVDRAERTAYETVPYFWSDWYKHRLQFAGNATDADSVSFVSGGPLEDKFVALYRSGDRIVAVATLNEQRKIMKFRRLIQTRGSWNDAISLRDSLQSGSAKVVAS